MTTVFPDGVDTWQDPVDTDALSTSPDGRDHQQHHADLNAVALETETQLVGPVFASVAAYDARSEVVLADCESLTGAVGVNNTLTLSNSTFTSGSHSLSFGGSSVGWHENPNLTTAAYINLPSDQDRDDRLQVAFDVRWTSTDFSLSNTLSLYFHAVASDAVDLGGNTVVWTLPSIDESTWTTVTVPISDLTKVRSIGLVSYAVDDFTKDSIVNIFIDNVRFAVQTPLERALGANPNGEVVVPGSYNTAQGVLLVPESVVMTDLRSDYIRPYGARDLREFQVPLDGTTDVRDILQAVMNTVPDGSKLVFPAGRRFFLSGGVTVRNKSDVEIDLNGCKFYTDQSVFHGAYFAITDCRYVTIGNGRLYGYAPHTKTGANMATFSGSPTYPGDGTATLTAQGDAVIISDQNQGYTVDDEIPFAVTIKQSGVSTNDACFEIVDSDAPTTAVTAAAKGDPSGPLAPGTYYYGVAFVDIDGRETTMGPRTAVTLTTGDKVSLTNIPIAAHIQYTGRKVFRTPGGGDFDDPRSFALVTHIRNNTDTTYTDSDSSSTLNPKSGEKCSTSLGAAGSVTTGTHVWTYTVVFSDGFETVQSIASPSLNVTPASHVNVTVPVSTIGRAGQTIVARKVYRSNANAAANSLQNYRYIGIINDNTTTAYDDNASDASVASNSQPPTERPAQVDPPSQAEWTTYVTPDSVNGVKTFIWKPVQQRDHPHAIIRKVSTDVNTITLTQCDVTTFAQYDAAAETAPGFSVAGSSKAIDIHDSFVTLVGEDAVFINSAEVEGVTVRRVTSYGCRRQGFAMNSGNNITFEDCEIHHPGRSGIDLEPYSGDNFATQISIRRVRIYNPKNSSIAAAGNWSKIRGLLVSDVYAYGSNSFGMGATSGRAEAVTSWWAAATIQGQNLHMTNSDVLALVVGGSDTATNATGGSVIRNVRLLTNTITDAGGNIFDGIYLVSGPSPTGTVSDITP